MNRIRQPTFDKENRIKKILHYQLTRKTGLF